MQKIHTLTLTLVFASGAVLAGSEKVSSGFTPYVPPSRAERPPSSIGVNSALPPNPYEEPVVRRDGKAYCPSIRMRMAVTSVPEEWVQGFRRRRVQYFPKEWQEISAVVGQSAHRSGDQTIMTCRVGSRDASVDVRSISPHGVRCSQIRGAGAFNCNERNQSRRGR